MRAQPLSIYLLKPGQTVKTAMDDGVVLEPLKAGALPPGAQLFSIRGKPSTPDWCQYLEVEDAPTRSSLGGILFIPTRKRLFAITFGPAYHKLSEDAYEYDFGLQVVLNAADPNKLKSADICEPGAARLRRTQGADESDLTLLDFKYDIEVLKNITARVHAEYAEWFESATGGESLKLRVKQRGERLGELCELLYKVYASNAWEKNFPGAQNISRVRDPALIQALDAQLLAGLRQGAPHLHLAIPEIIDHHGTARAKFIGLGAASPETEIFLKPYLDHLIARGVDLANLTVDALKRHKLLTTTADGAGKAYSVYRALIFETKLDTDPDTFHLLDRTWYRAKAAFVDKLHEDLDARWIPSLFPPYGHASEGHYNEALSEQKPAFALMDKTNVAPKGMTPVEPADHIIVQAGYAVLVHVKVSTFSFKLSHLFNQGTTAVELLRENDSARMALKRLINRRAHVDHLNAMSRAVDARKFAVIYAIVSHKDADAKSRNLPLFSRITLRRSIKALRAMDTEARFCFISAAKTPKKARRITAKKTGGAPTA